MAKIIKLLDAVKELEIVVPEFQREYVWSLDQAKDLMTSLFKDYPTGSLLVWETDTPPEIKNNAVKNEKLGWIQVLLDGQQRLTTLFLLIRGEIPPYYKTEDITHDPRHLYFNLQTGEFNYYQKQKMSDNPFWKSVVDCFNEDFDAFSLIESLKIENSEEKLKIGKTVNNNLTKLRSINQIDYYVQSVPQGANIDKAIDIFDLVNSRGTKLTDAELVLTHLAGKWPQIRREMKLKIEAYKKVGFEFELDFLTRGMVVLFTDSALFEKMTDEIYSKTSEEEYKETWKNLVKILDFIIPILKQNAFVGSSRDLNTNNVFIPIIAYLSKNNCSFSSVIKNQFLYWMFLASIWGRYSGQTDQRLDRDVYLAINSKQPINDLINEIEDQRGRIDIKPSDLEGRGAGHPLYKMLYVLAKYNKATDWANGGSIHETLGDYFSIQSHHIFPQAILYKNGYDSENHLDKQKVNEIANRAFITRDANYDISDEYPETYLEEVKSKYSDALAQQLIPPDKSLWKVEEYDNFLEARRQLIADGINSFLDHLKGGDIHEEEVNYQDIINKGENDYVEFKSSLRWDYNQNQVTKIPESMVAKTISAFMNSEGGVLLIGIKDNKEVLGLSKDLDYVNNKNIDGFLIQFDQVIATYLGKEFYQYVTPKIIQLDGKDVCVVEVESSKLPVFVKKEGREEFYVRAAASSQPLNMSEATTYIKTHWDN